MENVWYYCLYYVFPIIGFLGVVIPAGIFLYRRFKPIPIRISPLPPGMDACRYAKWLRGMADYVDGISKSPDEEKRELFKRGREEQEKHHHKAAIELFKECLRRAESSNEKAALHLQIGNSLSHLGEGERALIAYQEALQAARTGEDEDGKAAALGNTRKCLLRQG